MGRKTVNVSEVVEWANNYLASDTEPGSRVGVATLVEQVLHATGNYAGFRYLTSEYLPDGSGLKADYDGTRRHYSDGKVGK